MDGNSEAFPYLAVLTSIILGLAVQQVLLGYRDLILTRAKARLFAPVLTWSVLVLLIVAQNWWESFGLVDRQDWHFLGFGMILLQAVIIAAGLSGLRSKADPGKRYDIDMYAEGHTVTDAKKLPLNLLDAIREYDGDAALKEMMGAEFSSAFVKMKTQEWNSYMGHFSDWEKANALDI